MFFLQISRAPITVQIGKKLKARVPRFTLDEVVAWGQEVYQQNLDQITKEMTDVKRREYLTFYQPVPPDIQGMKTYLRTPEGIRQVIRRCLAKADILDDQGAARSKLTSEQIEKLLKTNGTGRLAGLALILADLDEQSIQSDEPEDSDPLPESGKQSSSESPKTGENISQSSTSAIPG